jgi:hypothetical protein
MTGLTTTRFTVARTGKVYGSQDGPPIGIIAYIQYVQKDGTDAARRDRISLRGTWSWDKFANAGDVLPQLRADAEAAWAQAWADPSSHALTV